MVARSRVRCPHALICALTMWQLAACQKLGDFAEFKLAEHVTDAGMDATSEPWRPSEQDAESIADGASSLPAPIAHWTFDDSDNELVDQSGNGHLMSLTNGAAIAPNAGRRGAALTFTTPTGEAIVSSLDGSSFPRSGTLSFWLYLDPETNFPDAGADGHRNLFDAYDVSRHHLFIRKLGEGPKIRIAFQAATPSYALFHDMDVDYDRWMHLAVSWSELGQGTVYFDGKEVRVDGFKSPFVPDGQRFRFGRGFSGRIDNVLLFDQVLSASQMLTTFSQ